MGGAATAARTPADVLRFWFGTPDPATAAPYRSVWFEPDAAFDAAVGAHLGDASAAAVEGGLAEWEAADAPALALVVLLDQVPRNRFRGDAAAFAGDGRARRVADLVLGRNGDVRFSPLARLFLYLPFEHSEDLADQDRACLLIGSLNEPRFLRHAEHHRDVIRRFGRFPHRNAALGRESTAAEAAFLAAPDAGF